MFYLISNRGHSWGSADLFVFLFCILHKDILVHKINAVNPSKTWCFLYFKAAIWPVLPIFYSCNKIYGSWTRCFCDKHLYNAGSQIRDWMLRWLTFFPQNDSFEVIPGIQIFQGQKMQYWKIDDRYVEIFLENGVLKCHQK